MAKARGTRLFTVLFYIDGRHGIETFCEHVTCGDLSEAFDKAVAKVKRGGGHMCASYELANATGIATFTGHLEEARV